MKRTLPLLLSLLLLLSCRKLPHTPSPPVPPAPAFAPALSWGGSVDAPKGLLPPFRLDGRRREPISSSVGRWTWDRWANIWDGIQNGDSLYGVPPEEIARVKEAYEKKSRADASS